MRDLLIKFANGMTFSVPVKWNLPNSSQKKVENIVNWSKDNGLVLNLGKTWQMVVGRKTKKQLPNPVPSIERKSSVNC